MLSHFPSLRSIATYKAIKVQLSYLGLAFCYFSGSKPITIKSNNVSLL